MREKKTKRGTNQNEKNLNSILATVYLVYIYLCVYLLF